MIDVLVVLINNNQMDSEKAKIRKVLTIIALAAFLAAVFDYLFFGKVVGISFLVFVGLFLAATFWLASDFKFTFRSLLWLLAPILFFSIMPVMRANPFLNFLSVMAVVGLLLLAARELLKEHITQFAIKEYFQTVFHLPLKFVASSIKPLLFVANSFNKSSTRKWRKVIIGILMALPILLLFTALFGSADLAFGQFVDSIVSLNLPETFFQHTFLMFIVFIGLLGAFEYVFKTSLTSSIINQSDVKKVINTTGRELETGTFLSLIAILFLVFIVFQVTYLFGGEVNIVSRGFTYAEYARHGFWELLTVAFATLVILLFTDKYTRRETSRKIWFTVPVSIIISEILVIIISAYKRLMLYQDTYGMTTLRFYVAGFIIFLGVIFILLALKFIFEKKENFFTFASLLTVIVFLTGVNLISPDAFIAQKNIAQFNQTGKIDVPYLASLSADAVPQILDIYDSLNNEDKIILRNSLTAQEQFLQDSQRAWQSYNFSSARALTEIHVFLLQNFGPCYGIPEGQCEE